jgi:hypothetical protein
MFTGEHPARHGIMGNEFFDRFGTHSQGKPRHYAFDVGDTLAVDDAVQVFLTGLASNCLEAPTIYERLAGCGWADSVVVGHMYARGAQEWLRPSLINLARFTKGGNLFGLSAPEFDGENLDRAQAYLSQHDLPRIFTMYFMGVDHESHRHGPQAQYDYLVNVVDQMVGKLWEDGWADPAPVASKSLGTLCVICSDHGQIGVPREDRHSLRLAFPFEREMGHLFDALGLDVHDYPGEDPDSEAVLALNGGLAHVYLRSRESGRWDEPPTFDQDVLPVGRAFWEAHSSGRFAPELQGALAGVLLRNVEKEGWEARYGALTPQGERVSLESWFTAQPAGLYVDPIHRIGQLSGRLSGDILLISNYEGGYYFGGPVSGVHGGLHPEDSCATLAFGWPDVSGNVWRRARRAITAAIEDRCRDEGGRQPSTADMVTGLLAVI